MKESLYFIGGVIIGLALVTGSIPALITGCLAVALAVLE